MPPMIDLAKRKVLVRFRASVGLSWIRVRVGVRVRARTGVRYEYELQLGSGSGVSDRFKVRQVTRATSLLGFTHLWLDE